MPVATAITAIEGRITEQIRYTDRRRAGPARAKVYHDGWTVSRKTSDVHAIVVEIDHSSDTAIEAVDRRNMAIESGLALTDWLKMQTRVGDMLVYWVIPPEVEVMDDIVRIVISVCQEYPHG